jgi:transcriptional regulator
MYLPTRFDCQDKVAIRSIIENNPLATIITCEQNEPFISHLPLVLEENEEKDWILVGHMARPNQHWKKIAGSTSTIIFHGPNAYITPKWYEHNDVPTWNYATIHLKGVTTLISDTNGIELCLKKLSDVSEKNSSDPWDFWIPDDLSGTSQLSSAIVGFKISITEVKAKFKLSQNRSPKDLEGILKGLEARQDAKSSEIAKLMRNRY